MPNFSRPRHVVLETLARNPATTLQNILRALGIGDNYTQSEYLRVHKLVTRLLQADLISRAKNSRHGLTSYSITPQGIDALAEFDHKLRDKLQSRIPNRDEFPQEMNEQMARKKKASSESPDEAPVRVTPVVSPVSPPPSLDVVRCPSCGFFVPANEVRHSLHATGTANCPKCQYDLSDVIGGRVEV